MADISLTKNRGFNMLPHPDYYALNELAERWNTTLSAVQHTIETGKLMAVIWLKPCLTEHGIIKRQQNGEEVYEAEFHQWVKGFVNVLSEDCRHIFRYGWTELFIFCSLERPQCFLRVCESVQGISVELADLVILKEELDRFECHYGINDKQNVGSNRLCYSNDDNSFSHSEDYQTVWIKSKTFRFGMVQAAIIRLLHEASRIDQPWVHGKILLDQSGSRSERVKSVFRNHLDWKECIESDGRGYYRLKI